MSIKKNIFYNVSLSVLNALFPIVTAPYISRVLGVENVGVIRFVTTCVSYFVLFAALGIGFYGVRELAKYREDQAKCSQIFTSLSTIVFCSTLVVTFFFILSINLIPEFKEHRLLFSVYGITLYLAPVTMDWYFQAKENFRMITIRSFVVKLLALASLFIFVRERNDVMPYILITVFSIVVTNVWNLCYAFKTGLRITLQKIDIHRHIKPMFVFMSSNVAIGVFVMINIVMLGFLSSYEQVGFYTSANIILIAITSFFAAISTALLPRLSFNDAQKNNETNAALLQKIFDLNALLIVPMAVGLCLISSRFIPLFFGREFVGSIVPMQILSLNLIITMFNYLLGFNVLMVFGYEKKYLYTVIYAALLSFALNLLIIPFYGAIGTAIVAIVSNVFCCGLLLYFVNKFTQIRFRWKEMGIATFFSLPFFALYFFCNMFITRDILFLLVFICLTTTIYFILQFFMKNHLVHQILYIGMRRFKSKKF